MTISDGVVPETLEITGIENPAPTRTGRRRLIAKVMTVGLEGRSKSDENGEVQNPGFLINRSGCKRVN